MSKRYRVKNDGAVVDGKPLGSTFELPEKSAKALEKIGYITILNQIHAKKKPAKKAKSAPKKPANKKADSEKK